MGPLDLVIGNDRKKREAFLFNDMLIVARADGDKLKSVDQVSFNMILINSPADEPGKYFWVVVYFRFDDEDGR